MELKQFFSEDFSTPQSQFPFLDLPQLPEPNAGCLMPSSSSSSLRSFSVETPDSSLVFTIPTTSATTAATEYPHNHAMQALSQIRSLHLPTLESEESAMVRAFLAVLTSPSSSSSSTAPFHQQALRQQHNLTYRTNQKRATSAFRRYFSSALGPSPSSQMLRTSWNKQNILKRAIMYYRRLNLSRRERTVGSRLTSSRLQHVMSERKRREKLNESFKTLRSLLPPATKRDKASLLASAREELSTLKAKVAELGKKNQLLEAQLLPSSTGASGEHGSIFPSEELDVGITHVSESSTSEEYYKIVNVRVSVRRECPMVDVLTGLLEFLKRDWTVSLVSVKATKFTASHDINLLLKIEGDEWDESGFLEAVRRLVDNLAPIH